jgi:hypothetical protein
MDKIKNVRMFIVDVFILMFLGALAAISFSYTITKTSDPSGAIDLHAYWYAGHFVRQGSDPYAAFLNDIAPDLPVVYLDGAIAYKLPIAHPGFALAPGLTAPLIWFFSLFSFFSWPMAKVLWMICNLACIIAIPILVLQLLPTERVFSPIQKLMLCLTFWGIFGTRNTGGNGQTGALVFLLMLLTLVLSPMSNFWAGIAFGIALSKYSLALPVFLILLIQRKYRIIVIGLLVQLLSLIGLAAITHTSPLTIFLEYFRLMLYHAGFPGIHFSSLFSSNGSLAIAAPIILTLATLLALGWFWWSSRAQPSFQASKLYHLYQFTALTLWTLLVAYHRAYDTLVVILFFMLAGSELINASPEKLSRLEKNLLAVFLLTSVLVMSLPARGITIIADFIPIPILASWLDLQGRGMTLVLLLMLACTIGLLYRYKSNGKIT